MPEKTAHNLNMNGFQQDIIIGWLFRYNSLFLFKETL